MSMDSRSSSYGSYSNSNNNNIRINEQQPQERNQETDSPSLSPMSWPFMNAQRRSRDHQEEEDVTMMPPLGSSSMPSAPPLSIDGEIRESNIGVYQEAGDSDHGGGNITNNNSLVIRDASAIECPICNNTFTNQIFT
ncbi:hypothetical protein Tco_1479423, partial [Tanacetum coccineum]